ASAAADGVRLWDLAKGQEVAFLSESVVRSVLFHPDGTSLVASSSKALLRWRLQSGAEGLRPQGPPNTLAAPAEGGLGRVGTDGRGKALALVTGDGKTSGKVYLLPWEAAREEPLFTASLHNLWSVTLSPDGRWLAAGGHNGSEVRLWDVVTGKLV